MMVTLPPDYRPSEDEEFMNPHSGRIFPPETAALARRPAARGRRHPGQPVRRRHPRSRHHRPRQRGNRPRAGAAHPRPRPQADLQDRPGAGAHRERHLRLLRGNRRADRPAGGWRRGPSPPCRSRRRSGMSAWSGCTATTDPAPRHQDAAMTRRTRVALVVGGVLGVFLLYEIVTSFVAYTGDAYVRSDLVAVAPEVTGPHHRRACHRQPDGQARRQAVHHRPGAVPTGHRRSATPTSTRRARRPPRTRTPPPRRRTSCRRRRRR